NNSQNVWWGKKFGDAQRLMLSPNLINGMDEDQNLDVKVLRSIEMPLIPNVDVYGNALDQLKSVLDDYGVELHECPYDWRRDIEFGASSLDKCLKDIRLKTTNA